MIACRLVRNKCFGSVSIYNMAFVLKSVLSWIVTGVILIIGLLSQLYKYSNILTI